MLDNSLATVAKTDWIITPEISVLEEKFVGSLVKVTANLTEAMRLIREIQDSGTWKTGYSRFTDSGEKAPVFTNFWDQYVPWLLAANIPAIGMDQDVSWFRARMRWWKYVESRGKSLEDAMAVPLTIQFKLERIVNLETGKFKLPPSKQLGEADAEDAASTLIDDVLDGKYTAQELTRMVEWQQLKLYSDGATVYAWLDHATKGTLYEPLFKVADVSDELMTAMTVKLRIKERTAEYEPGEGPEDDD